MKSMENTQKLNSISKIIDDTQIPKEIKQKIEELINKYENIICGCIDRLKMIETPNNIEQIMSVKHYIDKDFEGNVAIINSISQDAYIIKKEEMLNRIIHQMDELHNKEQKNNSNNELSIELYDGHEEERKDNEGNIEDRDEDKRSNEFLINTIKNNIISEFKSSRSAISQKIKDIQIVERDKKELYEYYKNRVIKIFEEEIENVIQKAEEEIPELRKVVEMQDEKIYEQIKSELERNEIPKENVAEQKQKDFRQSLSEGIEVSEEKALENLEKQTAKQKQLDENILS